MIITGALAEFRKAEKAACDRLGGDVPINYQNYFPALFEEMARFVRYIDSNGKVTANCRPCGDRKELIVNEGSLELVITRRTNKQELVKFIFNNGGVFALLGQQDFGLQIAKLESGEAPLKSEESEKLFEILFYTVAAVPHPRSRTKLAPAVAVS